MARKVKKTTKSRKKIKDLPAKAQKVKGGLIAFTGYSAATNLQAASTLGRAQQPGDPCRF